MFGTMVLEEMEQDDHQEMLAQGDFDDIIDIMTNEGSSDIFNDDIV